MQDSSWLSAYASFIVRHRWGILASILGVTVLLGIGVTRIYVEVDPDRQLPQDHPYIVALNESHRLFGDKNLIVIGLKPTNGDAFTPLFLAKVKAITDRIGELPGVVKPLLLSIASPIVKDIAAVDAGLRVQPLMSESPTTTEAAQNLKKQILGEPSYVGTLVSYGGDAFAIYATFELTSQLPGYVNLQRAVADVLADRQDGTFTYYLSGPVVIAASISIYANQLAYFFPIALLVIGLIHYHAFRSLQAVVLPLLTGILAVIWAVGLMGHLGVPLDALNSTTPVLILAIGAGHAVQILNRYYEEFIRLGDNDAAVISSIAKVGGVMIAACSIAALSFLSLGTLGTESIRIFGIFTSFGILSALVIELAMIPALRSVLRPPKLDRTGEREAHPNLRSALDYAGQQLSSPFIAKVVLGTSGAICLVSVLFASRIEVNTSLKRDFAVGTTVRDHDDTLNTLFAGTNSLLFLIEGPAEGGIAEPLALRSIEAFERRLEELPGVGKATSIVDTLKRLHKALNPTLDLGTLPETKDLATQYLFLYTLSGGNDLATQLTPDNRTTKVVVMLHEDSTRYGEEIIARANDIARQELPPGYKLHVAGTLASNAALTDAMVKGKIRNVVQIGAITIVVAAVILRSFLAGLLVAVPLVIAVLINLGVMGALDIPLDIATAAVTAMAVGIGADYAVYLLSRIREEYATLGDLEEATRTALCTSGKAIVFVSTAVAAGYSVLCLSGFRVFIQLGSMVALAMITSSLATLLVLPALVTLISRTARRDSILGTRRLSPEGRAHGDRTAAGF